jgi:hypothetical protein
MQENFVYPSVPKKWKFQSPIFFFLPARGADISNLLRKKKKKKKKKKKEKEKTFKKDKKKKKDNSKKGQEEKKKKNNNTEQGSNGRVGRKGREPWNYEGS